MPVGAAAKAFRLGLDLGEAFSALFDGKVGPDDLSLSFGLTFALSFHTSEGHESGKLKLDSFSKAFVVLQFPLS